MILAKDIRSFPAVPCVCQNDTAENIFVGLIEGLSMWTFTEEYLKEKKNDI